MIALSESARRSLDEYLRQVRAYLRGSKSVDRVEVEQNITEHIEDALEEANEPVSCEELEAVLKRLGSPEQWVPREELPWWRQMILRLRTGPEDWRLAYISFGLFVLSFLLLGTAPVLILASYLVSRAAVSETRDSKELKAQRWLIYPSLIVVHSVVSICLLLWPLVLFGGLAAEMEHSFSSPYFQFADDLDYYCVAWCIIVAILGLWWVVLGTMLSKWQKLQSVFLGPFDVSLKSKWIRTFSLIGSGLIFLSVCAGVLYYRYLC